MKVVAIVQARMGSTRLPDKVMKRIGGVPMIELLLSRLGRALEVDEIVVATSHDPRNQQLVDHVASLGFRCFPGSEDDVLDRYYQTASAAGADTIVRITGDCPLVDPELVDEIVRAFRTSAADYLSNTVSPSYPDGLDVEVFSMAALAAAWSEAVEPFDREHVTPYLHRTARFRQASFSNNEDLSALRWTVDEAADFSVIESVFRHFGPSTQFGWRDGSSSSAINKMLSRRTRT